MSKIQELYEAIKTHVDIEDETLIEAGNHGADAGWPGFCYYTDTNKFYDDNEDAIWGLLEENADSMGSDNIVAFIGGLGGVKDVGGITQFKNLLAWFALEEVGRALDDGNIESTEEEEADA